MGPEAASQAPHPEADADSEGLEVKAEMVDVRQYRRQYRNTCGD